MKTHPAITHPALRHRMAVALNQLRHNAPIRWELDFNHIAREAFREMAERMAALEQALDDEQEARIFG